MWALLFPLLFSVCTGTFPSSFYFVQEDQEVNPELVDRLLGLCHTPLNSTYGLDGCAQFWSVQSLLFCMHATYARKRTYLTCSMDAESCRGFSALPNGESCRLFEYNIRDCTKSSRYKLDQEVFYRRLPCQKCTAPEYLKSECTLFADTTCEAQKLLNSPIQFPISFDENVHPKKWY